MDGKASFLNEKTPELSRQVDLAKFIVDEEMVKKIINEPLSI
jgi:hypothetical protein